MMIFLSGGEVYRDFIPETKHQNFFVSFYTGYTGGAERAINTFSKKTIIVDSGAFSFMTQRGKSSASGFRSTVSGKTHIDYLDTYVENYCKFIDRVKDKVLSFVELDVDMIYGKQKVLEIRDKLHKHAGDKLMACYHSTMGTWEEEKKELFKYKFIGVEGIHARGKAHVDYIKVAKDCYEAKKFLHVFAMTKRDFLSKVPVCSTDSTSWSSIVRYGRSVLNIKRGLMKDFIRLRMRRHKAELRSTIVNEINDWHGFESELTDLWKFRGIDWHSNLEDYKL